MVEILQTIKSESQKTHMCPIHGKETCKSKPDEIHVCMRPENSDQSMLKWKEK